MKTPVRCLFAVLAVTVIAARASYGLTVRVPEIDPAAGIAALTLLCGIMLVIRGRSRG
jgi:hypothetical protein